MLQQLNQHFQHKSELREFWHLIKIMRIYHHRPRPLKRQSYLEWLRLCRVLPVLHQAHHFPDLNDGKGNGDPGGAREHPGRLVHVLLLLLEPGLLDWCNGSLVAQGGATDGALTLHLDGGDGNWAGRDWDVLSQDLIFCWRKYSRCP